MKFKTLLIDDEPLALQRLERLLQPHADCVEILDRASNGHEAVEKINALKPDLIFLDIQMPELNGFEVLERIEHLPLIIFSTAYDEYALKAFETNSIDYLLKPVSPERLKQSLEKLKNLTSRDKQILNDQFHNLLSSFKKKPAKRIQVRVGDHIQFLNLSDIYFFRAKDKYVEVHTFEKPFLIDQSLILLETQLPEEDFVRIHRSAIVNLNHIDEMIKWFNGTYRVRMRDKNKTELPVSRNYKKNISFGFR